MVSIATRSASLVDWTMTRRTYYKLKWYFIFYRVIPHVACIELTNFHRILHNCDHTIYLSSTHFFTYRRLYIYTLYALTTRNRLCVIRQKCWALYTFILSKNCAIDCLQNTVKKKYIISRAHIISVIYYSEWGKINLLRSEAERPALNYKYQHGWSSSGNEAYIYRQESTRFERKKKET